MSFEIRKGRAGMEIYQAIRRMWQSYRIDSVQALDRYLDNFRILFAYHSGKIENSEIDWHDTRDIFENGRVECFSGNPRTIFEQQNQKTCYEYLKHKIIVREPMTITLIRDIYLALTSGTYDEQRFLQNNERPGEFKKHDYITGRHEVGAAPDRIEADLQELLDEINTYSGLEVLKAAAYFHLRFEHIHPFADGNGRVGRTLLNYYLLIHAEPPVIIHEENRKSYYAALEDYDANELIQPMLDLLIAETVETWKATLDRSQGQKHRTKRELQDLT